LKVHFIGYILNNEYAFLAILDADEKELKKVERGDEFMEKYKEEIERLNEDPEFVEFLTQEEDNQKRFNTLVHIAHNEGLATGEKAGLEKGQKIGIEKRNQEIAKNLLKLNISVEDIVKATGLTKKDIEILK
jgi:predicted transposase/invertase (TIGR01784 family)